MTGLHPLMNHQLVDTIQDTRRREAREHRLAAGLTRRPRPWFVTLFVR